MKGKHAKLTARKRTLAKRMLALCFVVVLLCSVLLPVFATEPLQSIAETEMTTEAAAELTPETTDTESIPELESTEVDLPEDEQSEEVAEEIPEETVSDTLPLEGMSDVNMDELDLDEGDEWLDAETGDAAEFAIDTYASQPRTTDFTFAVENAEVVYVHYDSTISATEAGNLEFESVTGPFTTDWDHQYDNYWVFFVKPKKNYMVTGIGATGYDASYRNDIYSVDGNYTNIRTYPGIDALVERAKGLGYVGLFGYSRKRGNNTTFDSADVSVIGEQPPITVEAVSDKTENVKPDDLLTFTVTITPGHTAGLSSTGYTGRETVEDVVIESLVINGVDYKDSCTVLVANADGTYTTTVLYTATRSDCNAGLVKLDVTASVDYKVKLNAKDEDNVETDATIESSATAECLIAPKSQVRYLTYIENAPASYPEELDEYPVDSRNYYVDDPVTVDTDYPGKTVADPENNGIWTFDGWYLDELPVTEATMTEDGLVFEGTWRFKRTTSSFTVGKSVRGNMADPDYEFSFAITVKDADGTPLDFQLDGVKETGMAYFTLKDGEELPLTQVPVGATILITEMDAEGYKVNAQLDAEYLSTDWQEDGGSFTFTVAQPAVQTYATYAADDEETSLVLLSAVDGGELAEGSKVTILNKRELPVPTGVSLDAMPYLLLLTFSGAGMLTLRLRRREE